MNLVCPICGEKEHDRLGMAFHFNECEQAAELMDDWRKKQKKEREEKLKHFKL